MNKRMTVTMPVLNGEETLRQALDSVVNQSSSSWKIVALDDGSDDGSLDILNEYREKLGDEKMIVIVHKERKGLPITMNDIYDFCKTEFVTWLAADDFLYRTKIEHDIEYMDRYKDVDILWTSYDVVNKQGIYSYKASNYTDPNNIKDVLPYHFEASWASICFRKKRTFDVLSKVDGFICDTTFKRTVDWDLNIRFSKFCKFAYLPESFMGYRLHEGQGSHSPEHHDDNNIVINRVDDGFYNTDRYSEYRVKE